LTRTWTATDECGNSTSHVQTITVQDTTAPVFVGEVLPQDITVDCEAIPEAYNLSASDNCSSSSEGITIDFTEVRTEGDCPNNYTLTRTWTATDECGNSTSHVQTITVQDTTAPVFVGEVLPQEITVDCEAVPEAYNLSASDNCSTSEVITIDFNEVRTDGDCPNSYTLTRTWTATDECGNTTTHVQTITVQDTTAPVFDGEVLPQDITVDCDAIPEAYNLSVSDNCSSSSEWITIDFTEVRTDGDCPNNYTLVRTWTATDECGNSTSHVQTITVQDTAAPVFDGEVLPQDITVDCDAVPEAYNLSASDNCSSSSEGITIDFNEVRTDGDCPNNYTLTRTWTATDECGNTTSHVQTITVQDTTAPVFIGEVLPQDITVDCDAIPETDYLSATDNCSSSSEGITIDFTEVRTEGDCPNNYTLTRTWTATDECGNTTSHVQTITFQDTAAPVFDGEVLPQDITVDCDAIPEAYNLSASDNCSSSEVMSIDFTEERINGECEQYFTLIRTWTATDECGNSTSYVQTITVQDTTAPVFDGEVLPQDITVDCDAIPEAYNLSASDNCSSSSEGITIDFNEVRTDGDCTNNYTLTRTWTATDECGNSTSHVQTITVQDTAAPVFDGEVLPQDITVDCDAIPEAYNLSASDNCSSSSEGITIDFNEVRTDGDCPNSYTLVRTWTATDECGNSTSHVQTITVQDTTAPVFDGEVLPQDITVDCDAIPEADYLSTTDNCSSSSEGITIDFTEVRTDGDCPNNYTLTRTWTATDECGNSTSHVQTITVQDTTAPVFDGEVLPQDITVDCDAIPEADYLSASDNCSSSSEGITIDFTEERINGECEQYFTLVRTWTATDECGNSTSHVQTITVQDTTAPVFVGEVLPQDITVDCDAIPEADYLSATDNCSSSSEGVTIELFEDYLEGECQNSYTLVRTWTATDECGNSTSHVQTITVQDTTAPFFDGEVLPQDITVDCDAIPEADYLSATDNCSSSSDGITIDFTEVRTDGNCPNNYTLTRTWTATDECGNSTSHVQTVTVQDTTKPIFVEALPNEITVNCDDVPSAETLTATDNCSQINVTYSEVRTEGDCPNNYTLTRTWTATDECGNTTSHVQTITVQDTTAPVFDGEVLPQDIIVDCDAVLEADYLSASDNCSSSSEGITIDFNEVRTDGDCTNNYTLTRTWTATDECGNSTSHVQTITVQDTTAPVFDGEVLPQDITVDCEAVPEAYNLSASDNCSSSEVITIDFTEERINGECEHYFALVRTWMATDECGNSTSHVQTITVQDTTAPVFDGEVLPQDITVDCDAIPEAYNLSASDNCSSSSEGITIDFTEVRTEGDFPNNYTLVRTWTATDECGNTTTHVQTITVQDTTAPVFDGEVLPQDITVDCDAIPEAYILSASDNCSSSSEGITIDFNEVRTDGDCTNNYTLTRTWTATDECGNSTSHVQTITVQDTTAPVFDGEVLPQDITVDCDAVPEAYNLSATDNCSSSSEGVTVELFEDYLEGECQNSYTIVRTWTATDECGNSTSYVQTITVQDTTAPVFDGEVLPQDITVDCDAIPEADYLSAIDNCSSSSEGIIVELFEDYIEGECQNSYTIVRTWTVTDECGNSTTHVQTITVQDTTAPVFDGEVLPQDIVVDCEAVPEAYILSASDNCSSSSEGITIDFTEERINGECEHYFALVRTWTATDECGNSTSHVQNITVQDTIAPVFDGEVLPQDITVDCDAIPEAYNLSATDNCSSSSEGITIDFTEVRTDGDCPNNYTLTRTWTATDECGNSTSHVQTITVQDTTAPVFDGEVLPQDITVDCEAIPEAYILSASDNCSSSSEGITIDFTEVRTDGDCPNNYTLTRTWMSTDECGNTTTHVQTITVQDTTAPVFDGEVLPQDITVDCDAIPEAYSLSASDNCSSSSEGITIDFTEVRTDGDCPNNYTLVRTWTATDECGNSTSHVQTITVQDTTAPVFDGEVLPQDITVDCDAIPEAYILSASDNCSSSSEGVTVELFEDYLDGECQNSYTIVRTWTATDECGNTTSHVQTIAVQDTTAPFFDGEVLPQDITVDCDAIPEAYNLSASDNCSSSEGITIDFTEVRTDGNCPNNYTLIRTWTATDECGNSTSHVQTITVQDTTAPVFDGEVLPQDITVDCEAIPEAYILSASDNCSSSSEGVTIELFEDYLEGECQNSYTIVRTWTATDECGNSTSHVQTITVQDTTAPVFDGEVLPQDITVDCDAIPEAYILSASDNCSSSSEGITIDFTEVRTDGDCPNNYTLTRTWMSTDECGNTTTHVQTITVQDTTVPVFDGEVLPQDITVDCDAIPEAYNLSASDNCSSSEVMSIDFTEERINGECEQYFTLIRTWTATDECGNSTSHIQTITVQDITAPVFDGEVLPQDITVDCDAVPEAYNLSASDNCSSSEVITIDFTEERINGECEHYFALVRTWMATDECGNSTSHVQTITVQDTTAPVFDGEVLPQDITVDCDAIPEAYNLSASDNCSSSSEGITIDFTEVRTEGDFPNNYTLVRTWTATDECGNSTSHVQTITVQDTTAPVFVGEVLPQDITVDCEAVLEADYLSASDNCSSSSEGITIDFNEVRTDGDCTNNYTLTRTWTATDECGNSTSHVQTITVQDTTAPVFDGEVLPQDITVDCEAVPEAYNLSATDNCSSSSEGIIVDFVEERFEGECQNSYTIVRTWTATDECGNSTSHVQNITVQDTTAPVFDGEVLPQDITVDCDAIPEAYNLSASDNCSSSEVISINFTEVRTDGDCPNNYTLTRTWTATDECGNSTSHVQTITVLDSIAPVFDGEVLPQDITVDCDAIPEAYNLSATDNCSSSSEGVTIELFEDYLEGECQNSYTLVRTWTATDECGNSTSHVQTITVQDTTAPVFDGEVLPQDIMVDCEAIPEAYILSASDNCSSSSEGITIDFTEERINGECEQYFTLIRTWTATDECGNSTSHVQNITVQDTTAPVFDGEVLPQDITVDCDAVPEAYNLSASDNCSSSSEGITIDFNEVRTDGDCTNNYTLTRTWTATDECGNSTSHVQTITVQDTTAPVFDGEVLPQDMTVDCDAVPEAYNLSASDNCSSSSEGITIDFTEVRTDGDCPNNYTLTRTWTATDECGNSTSHAQTITVQDTTAPVFDGEVLPQDIMVDCEAIPEAYILSASDNCSSSSEGITIDFTEERINGECEQYFTLIRTWTATDECGNSTSHVQNITVQDTTAPVFDGEVLPQDITVDCDAVPEAYNLSASDNCSSSSEGITIDFNEVRTDGDCTNNYTLTRTWTATDECGNSTSHVQTVTVQDTTKPVLTITDPFFANVENGQTLVIQCRAMDKDWELPTLLDSEITISDNCGTPTYTMTQDVLEGTCSENGYFKKIVVKIKVTDLCYNEVNLNFDILVVDTIAPVFTRIPEDVTVSCEEIDKIFEISATDECECAYISSKDTTIAGGLYGNYTILRTYTAKDCCGNFSTYTQKIYVVDRSGPELISISSYLNGITNGDTLTRSCGEIEIPEWLHSDASKLMTAVDACSGNAAVWMDVKLSNQDACWNYGYLKLYTVTFNAVDDHGNPSVFMFYIKIEDKTPPVVRYIEETVCETDSTYPFVFDNCSEITYSFVDEPISGSCPQTTDYIRTWTFSDACGNTSYATQYVTGNDHKAPVMSLVDGPFKGELNGSVFKVKCSDWSEVDEATLLSWMGAQDECDIFKTVVKTFINNGDCIKDGYSKQINYVWFATDNCGNTSQFSLYIQLIDDEKPYFIPNAAEIYVDCESKIPMVRAYDNCSSVDLKVESYQVESNDKGVIIYNEKYIAVDGCGNSAVLTRKVYVDNKKGPIIYAPEVVCEGDAGNGKPYALDYCSNKPVPLKGEKSDKIYECDGGKYYEVTYTATDDFGNTTTMIQRVIIDDRQAPSLAFSYDFMAKYNFSPANPVIEVSSEEFNTLVNAIGKDAYVEVLDNCSVAIPIVKTQELLDTYCDEKLIHTDYHFAWTATDVCGNSSGLNLIVKMSTSKVPDMSFVPKDTTVYCLSKVPIIATPALTCGFVKIDTKVVNETPKANGDYDEVRIWTIENACGERYSASQTIHHLNNDASLSCSIIAPQVFCNSSENIINVDVTGGSGEYTYYWEVLNGSCHIISGQGTSQLKISIAFKTLQLKLTVADANGCTSESNSAVKVFKNRIVLIMRVIPMYESFQWFL
jgi:hypothetical protein